MSASFVEEQKTEPLAALDGDNDDSSGKEEPDERPRFARGTSSFYIAARDAYVSRASRLVVRRPKCILASVLAAVVVAGAALVSQGLTTRQEKFDYSIRKMGETVLAGAITTAGSTVFLLACQLTFFTAMGTLIILTVAYSLGYSLLFFMPLLRVAGPEGRVGDICHFLRGLKCACCRRA